MRFGIFDHVERRNNVGTAQQYEERLQFAAAVDAAGFYCYHVAEHHHSPLCLAPNQAVYLAAVAQRTQRLRLSTLVYVLPLHNASGNPVLSLVSRRPVPRSQTPCPRRFWPGAESRPGPRVLPATV